MLFPPDWFIWLPLIGKRKIGYKGICVDLFFWNYWLASSPNLMRPGGEGGNSSESGDGEGGERERRAICPGWRAYPSPHQPTWFPELSTREHTRVWGDLADTVSESSARLMHLLAPDEIVSKPLSGHITPAPWHIQQGRSPDGCHLFAGDSEPCSANVY